MSNSEEIFCMLDSLEDDMKVVHQQLVETQEYVDDLRCDLASLSALLDKAEGK